MTPAPLPITSPPPTVPRTPGTCRVCGCTDAEACEIAEAAPSDPTPEARTCSWVEDDLCSRCHSPTHPTRAQAGELARIRAVKGPIRIYRGAGAGDLDVELLQPTNLEGFPGRVRLYARIRLELLQPTNLEGFPGRVRPYARIRLDRRGRPIR